MVLSVGADFLAYHFFEVLSNRHSLNYTSFPTAFVGFCSDRMVEQVHHQPLHRTHKAAALRQTSRKTWKKTAQRPVGELSYTLGKNESLSQDTSRRTTLDQLLLRSSIGPRNDRLVPPVWNDLANVGANVMLHTLEVWISLLVLASHLILYCVTGACGHRHECDAQD